MSRPRKLMKTRITSAQRQSFQQIVNRSLDDLERAGLIERTLLPNGDVKIRLPLAPHPICDQYLIIGD